MDNGIHIQLPNPQGNIYNSQSFQAPVPSSSSSFFTLRNISLISLAVLVIGGVGMGVMSIKNAADNYSNRVTKRSEDIAAILEEANSSASLSVVGKANATYENPFDEETAYSNPFEEDENPF